jgi:hypothetical protein
MADTKSSSVLPNQNRLVLIVALIAMGVALALLTNCVDRSQQGNAQQGSGDLSKQKAVTNTEQNVGSPRPSQGAAYVEIDLPKLAFAKTDLVERALGRSERVRKDTNMMDWSEGPIVDIAYKHADCMYLRGRLVSITYKFRKRPATAADALEWTGFPREAVSLDNEHQDHLPYRAFYAPNPDYRNPIRCCGLLLQWVSIPENKDHILVNFANINDHFRDWPEEIRYEWLRAGGESIH